MTHKVCVVGVCAQGKGGIGGIALCQIGGEVPEFAIYSFWDFFY